MTSPQPSTDLAGLVVLVRNLAQLEALIPLTNLPISSVVADLEKPRDLREAVAIGSGLWPDGIWLAGARSTRPMSHGVLNRKFEPVQTATCCAMPINWNASYPWLPASVAFP